MCSSDLVFDISDELRIRPLRAGLELIEQCAHRVNNVEVGLFVPAANVVGLTQAAACQDGADAAAMVAHIQPIANLLTVAVDRQRLARQCIDDHEWDELFWEMVGSVVVGAIGGEHRQAVGVMPGAHQMIARRLGCRVRAIRSDWSFLGEEARWSEAAVNFVGRDLQVASELRLPSGIEKASLKSAQIEKLTEFLEGGELNPDSWREGRIALTPNGRLVADRIVRKILF